MAGVVRSLQIYDIIAVVTSAYIFGSINSFHIFTGFLLEYCFFASSSQFFLREWRYRGEILSTDMAWLGASQVFLQGISAVG